MTDHAPSAPAAPAPAQTVVAPKAARAAAAAAGMKKFSKLFSRLGRGRPADPNGNNSAPEWDTASTRESSPDVHQLTSKRRRGEVKRLARNGLSRIVVDEQNPPCVACAAIDFPKLLNWAPGQPRPWIPLAHTLVGVSECPYCIFFQALVGAAPDETRKFTPYLRIRQAFERLGVGEKHELGSAVIFEVTTKSKSLPWGYIVKAIDDENDQSGYREGKPQLRGRVIAPKMDPVLPRTWIDFCMVNHTFTGCGTVRGPVIRGLKLIDCREEAVVSVEDLNAEAIEYVTLSYVGGKGDGGELHPRQVELPDVMPPLIADAMSVTKALGFRYLWVDRHCFPQFNAAERRRQLNLMGDIFSRSALTLIIAAGGGVEDGIPGVSVPREEQLSLKTDAGFFTTSLIRPDTEVSHSKWAGRGWTYQEGLFARRRLVFTPSQIYFQCQSIHCHESILYPLKTKPTLNLGRVFPLANAGTHTGEFKNQINDYISRDFTAFEDRLDAFRGVLDRYAQMDPPMENFLGLPLFDVKEFKNVAKPTRTDRLAVGLSWKPDNMIDDPSYVHPMYLQGPTFPSWTWLAWKLRPDYHGTGPQFHFSDVGDESPLIDNLTAVPGLELSVGFKHDVVLSWENDAALLTEISDPVSFLRVKTHCFDMSLNKDPSGTITLTTPDLKDALRPALTSALLRASTFPDTDPPTGNHDLLGVLISGRDFKGGGESFEGVNILVCGRRDWESEGEFVRLGTMEFGAGGGLEGGMVRGVLNGEKKLDVAVREVDIY
ncbi:Fc.00g051200.m01.CDS01 [Cosmosporella sp. VM-42]